MALQGFDGFDFYSGVGATTGLGLRWASNGTVDVAAMVAGRYGAGQAVELGDTTGTGDFSRRQLTVADFGPNFTIGFDVNTNSFSNQAGAQFLSVWNAAGGVANIAIGYSTNGVINVFTGGNSFSGGYNGVNRINTAANIAVLNTPRHIILQGFLDDTAGFLSLYAENADGDMPLVGSFTGDTKANATAEMARIFMTGPGSTGSSTRTRFDNLYWANDSSMAIKPRRIRAVRPSADATRLELTPSTGVSHFDKVNETTFDSVDWLTGSTVGLADDLGLTDLPFDSSVVEGVQVVSYANKTDAAARAIKLGLVTGGEVAYAENHVLATTPSVKHGIINLNPATGLPWTFDDIQATNIRAEIAA